VPADDAVRLDEKTRETGRKVTEEAVWDVVLKERSDVVWEITKVVRFVSHETQKIPQRLTVVLAEASDAQLLLQWVIDQISEPISVLSSAYNPKL